MSRNIIICCDGTGNEIKSDLSNVLKTYQVSERSNEQILYYDPGVGTIGRQNSWTKIRDASMKLISGMLGLGLDRNVLEAYDFLSKNYRDGDQIFLFGFSRGAYTVRVLAGFIRAIGLLRPEQMNLSSYALKWYKQLSYTGRFEDIGRFSEITKARDVTIHFLGVWDTVRSLLRPSGKLLTLGFTNKKYPFTVNNDAIKNVRHAVSIDEKRRAFPADLWGPKRKFKSHRFDQTPADQSVKEVWFAGVHSDVGGGYPESESALAKIPLKWMIVEAVGKGLKISNTRFERIVLGATSKRSKRVYVGPDPLGMIHNSFTMPTCLAGSKRRQIKNDAVVHKSVKARIDSEGHLYAPDNLSEDLVQWEQDLDLPDT